MLKIGDIVIGINPSQWLEKEGECEIVKIDEDYLGKRAYILKSLKKDEVFDFVYFLEGELELVNKMEFKEESLGEFKMIVKDGSLFLQDRNNDVVEILKEDYEMIINKMEEIFKNER